MEQRSEEVDCWINFLLLLLLFFDCFVLQIKTWSLFFSLPLKMPEHLLWDQDTSVTYVANKDKLCFMKLDNA